MASNVYIASTTNGLVKMRRDVPQGRMPSLDPKKATPLRLRQSVKSQIAALGRTEQEFIEHAVYVVLQQLTNH